MKGDVVVDMTAIPQPTQDDIEKGAVTGGNRSDVKIVLKLLSEALAAEIVFMRRCRRHYLMAKDIHADAIASAFLEDSNEQDLSDQLAARITELGGQMKLDPATSISSCDADGKEGSSLDEMVQEELVAERIAIDSYTDMIRCLGTDDSTTRKALEEILSEEEHSDELTNISDHHDASPPSGHDTRRSSSN